MRRLRHGPWLTVWLLASGGAAGLACTSLSGLSGSADAGTDHDAATTGDSASADADAATAADALAPPPCNDAAVSDDAHNCGRCGHDCRGGACKASVCQPFTLADETNSGSLFVDPARVYWTGVSSGSGTPGIFDCPLDGCGTGPNRYATGELAATDGTNVYWSFRLPDGTAKMSTCTGGDTCTSSTTLATVADTVAAVGAGVGQLYYWSYSSNVKKCAAAGCGGTPALFAHASGEYGVDLLVGGGNVYWVERQALSDGGTGTMLWACAEAGCASPTSLATWNVWPLQGTRSLGVDAKSVYWIEGTSSSSVNRIQMCPHAGCATPTTFASGLGEVFGVASDGTTVFWTDATTGQINSCPAGVPCTDPKEFVGGEPRPQFIAVDGASVYWTVATSTGSGSGPIRKRAK